MNRSLQKQKAMLLIFVLVFLGIFALATLVLAENTHLSLKINEAQWYNLQRKQLTREALNTLEKQLEKSPEREETCFAEDNNVHDYFNASLESYKTNCLLRFKNGDAYYILEALGTDQSAYLLLKHKLPSQGLSFYRITLWTKLITDNYPRVTQVTIALPDNITMNPHLLAESPDATQYYDYGEQSFREG